MLEQDKAVLVVQEQNLHHALAVLAVLVAKAQIEQDELAAQELQAALAAELQSCRETRSCTSASQLQLRLCGRHGAALPHSTAVFTDTRAARPCSLPMAACLLLYVTLCMPPPPPASPLSLTVHCVHPLSLTWQEC